MEDQGNLYLTLDEAAKILRVNPRQVVTMIKANKLRAKNINASGDQKKVWRILKEDVLKTDSIQA